MIVSGLFGGMSRGRAARLVAALSHESPDVLPDTMCEEEASPA